MADGTGARRANESAIGMTGGAFYAGVSAIERKAGFAVVEAAKGELLCLRRKQPEKGRGDKHDEERDKRSRTDHHFPQMALSAVSADLCSSAGSAHKKQRPPRHSKLCACAKPEPLM